MSERRNPDGSLSVGILEDMDARIAKPVEEEPKPEKKPVKKTSKKK